VAEEVLDLGRPLVRRAAAVAETVAQIRSFSSNVFYGFAHDD
jgi:hypothetical protein